MPDLLIEIGCEEIPARMVDAARLQLQFGLLNSLKDQGLRDADFQTTPDRIESEAFSTPRRLACLVRGLLSTQPDTNEEVVGPSAKIAFNEGKPTPAAEAFARKVGIDVSNLQTVTTPKGKYVSAVRLRKGLSAEKVLPEILIQQIGDLFWPKNMYWRKPNERFVRPVRWLVAMLGGEIVPFEFAGVRSGSESRGHRALSVGSVKIPLAASYEGSLKLAKVIVSEGDRKTEIRSQLVAQAGNNLRFRQDSELLDKVANLTEFPTVILGNFDPTFLELPEEVLVTVMRDHQNYFSVEDLNKKLAPHFLAVLNTDGDPQGLIRHGNERVLRARFNDAQFFWQTDQKRSLLERTELLRHVTFQKDLGSYYEKTQRVQRLCSWLSEIVKQSGMAVRAGVIHKAACLAKTDLTTELVKEFTELQGIVGGLYARAQELDSTLPEATRFAIADAIYDQYKPESTEDDVPRSIEGAVLSIGDKADTIAGMFALGLLPSGSKDPFALRRQANAIVKVIAEKKLPFRLSDLMRDARAGYQGSEAEKKFVGDEKFAESVKTFFRERLEFYLKEVRGYSYDVVKAVLVADADDVVDALARAEAVTKARSSEDAKDLEAVCFSFKRIKNILRQAEEKEISIPERPDEGLMGGVHSAETDLWINGHVNAGAYYETRREEGNYDSAISHAVSLRPMLDRFFDEVMVMVDDEQIRANRLAILKTLYTSFSTIADFSEIVTEGKT